MAESDTWEKREDLENVRETLEEFKKRMDAEVKKQERINMAEEKDFRRGELLGKYMAKLEKNWKRWKEDRQIDENEYLRRIEEKEEKKEEKIYERNWRTEHFSREEILKGG